MALIGKDILYAKKLLEKGELVSIPTETVYGLAANALLPDAVVKIFEVKNRPYFDPLILHVSKKDDIERYGKNITTIIRKLIEHFWPGPLSIVVEKKNIIPDVVTSGLPTVAIRMPNHSLTLSLLDSVNFPLSAPSANVFGKISPTSPQHVEKQLGNKIKFILDGGKTLVGIESTIVRVNREKLIILREGAVSAEDLAEITGEMPEKIKTQKITASGQFEKHYATHTPLKIIRPDEDLNNYTNKHIVFLRFKEYLSSVATDFQRVLSFHADLHEAAKNLFQYLHELDEMNADLILAESVPDTGIGRAINDRLKKAAASH